MAPLTKPALSLALKRGAIDLPLRLLENITTVAPVAATACAITLVNTCASK